MAKHRFDGTIPGPGRPKGAKNKLSRERIEEEVRRLAFLDPARLFFGTDSQGRIRVKKRFTLREIYDMPPEVRACIASVKVRTENLEGGDGEQDTTIEIKLWDKTKALDLASKFFGMQKEKLEISGDISALLEEGRARVAAGRKKA